MKIENPQISARIFPKNNSLFCELEKNNSKIYILAKKQTNSRQFRVFLLKMEEFRHLRHVFEMELK